MAKVAVPQLRQINCALVKVLLINFSKLVQEVKMLVYVLMLVTFASLSVVDSGKFYFKGGGGGPWSEKLETQF